MVSFRVLEREAKRTKREADLTRKEREGFSFLHRSNLTKLSSESTERQTLT